MIRSKSTVLALAALAGLSSFAMADTLYVSSTATPGTYNSGTGAYTGGGAGTLASPFGSIAEAYRAAYVSGGSTTIQLEDGTYSGANLGTYNGNAGTVNLGGDGYFGQGAPGANTVITIQGDVANPALTTISGSAYGGVNVAYGIFRAQNAYGTGLTIQDVKINTSGSPELFGSTTYQGFPVAFSKDNIELGSSSVFYYENSQIPGGEFSLSNSTIKLDSTIGGHEVLGVVDQNYNGGTGPNADIFDGNNSSGIVDGSGNEIPLSNLYLEERGPVPPYTAYYQNGKNFDQSGSSPDFAQNFVAVPEPASLSLLGLGALGLMARRRRA